jgi:hypothetical protein
MDAGDQLTSKSRIHLRTVPHSSQITDENFPFSSAWINCFVTLKTDGPLPISSIYEMDIHNKFTEWAVAWAVKLNGIAAHRFPQS